MCEEQIKIRLQDKKVNLEFEVGKSYKTKFATGESFKITKIFKRIFVKGGNLNWNPDDQKNPEFVDKDGKYIYWLMGIYENSPHLGDCPLTPDRLFPEQTAIKEETKYCGCCNRDL